MAADIRLACIDTTRRDAYARVAAKTYCALCVANGAACNHAHMHHVSARRARVYKKQSAMGYRKSFPCPVFDEVPPLPIWGLEIFID